MHEFMQPRCSVVRLLSVPDRTRGLVPTYEFVRCPPELLGLMQPPRLQLGPARAAPGSGIFPWRQGRSRSQVRRSPRVGHRRLGRHRHHRARREEIERHCRCSCRSWRRCRRRRVIRCGGARSRRASTGRALVAHLLLHLPLLHPLLPRGGGGGGGLSGGTTRLRGRRSHSGPSRGSSAPRPQRHHAEPLTRGRRRRRGARRRGARQRRHWQR